LALADILKNDFSIFFTLQKRDSAIEKLISKITIQVDTLKPTDNYSEEAINYSNTLIAENIVVLDGYHFNTEYQQAIKNKGCKLVVIDDLHSWHQVADVIINHAEGVPPSAYSKEDYTTLCLGLDYVLLRKPFLNAKHSAKKITAVKKVFISMGAADVNNITQKFTEALLQIKGIEEIHLMLGAINPNLKQIEKLIEENKHINIKQHFNISADELAELLKQCDVSICPASSISLESCAIGIGLISGYTAENQLGNLLGMEKRKTLINFGDMNLLTVDEIKQRLSSVFIHPEQLNELIENQAKMIDGKSPERLLKVFKELLNK
jgi:UDP-2,4-diacetamido-2,4,6-trideoxy-beta-L-altropyranose hydrolase